MSAGNSGDFPDPMTVRDAVEQLLERSSGFFDGQAPIEISDSPYSRDLATSNPRESLETAVTLGDLFIEHAADHLAAFAGNISDQTNPFACCTCIRSLLEGAATGAWLLDPDVSSSERIGRVFALRSAAIHEQLKFGRCIGRQESEIANLESHLATIVSDAAALGYPAIASEKGRPATIGTRLLGATQLIGLVLNDEWLYRLLSAVVHGQSWAIVNLGFARTSSEQHSDVDRPKGVRLEKAAPPQLIILLGLHGVLAFARLAWRRANYLGLDSGPLQTILNDTADGLKAKPGVRFWN